MVASATALLLWQGCRPLCQKVNAPAFNQLRACLYMKKSRLVCVADVQPNVLPVA
jgi:hypothetical protein